MCGIFARFSRAAESTTNLAEISQRLAHRGPDAEGAVTWFGDEKPQVVEDFGKPCAGHVLLHRRLAIIDLDHHADQPFVSADGRHWLIFNGEIYNYRELRSEIEAEGVTFRTSSDTEVLLAAWRLWGPDCLSRLEGMFAFVIFDRRQNKAVAARDPFGIKPLFFKVSHSEILLSSELSPITFHDSPDKLEAKSAAQAIRWGMNDGHGASLIPGVRRLSPGTYCMIDLNGQASMADPVRYCDLQTVQQEDWDYGEATQKLRETFLGSVDRHLRSDASLGFALSGGIDSSAIVCAAHELGREGIKTFSYVPQDERISERKWIDIVARHVGAETHFIQPQRSDVAAKLAEVIRSQGEPFASLSIYAQYELYAEVARQDVKVLLSGQGADELLAGYISYYQAAAFQDIAKGRLKTGISRLHSLDAHFGVGWKSSLLWMLRLSLPQKLRNQMARVNFASRAPWADTHAMAENGMRNWAELRPRSAANSSVSGMLRDSIENSLVALLRYDDRNSMAHSVESRVPFLTLDMARLCLSFPDSFLIDDAGVTKRIFRDAMRGIVPEEILQRQDKLGFTPDNSNWRDALGSFIPSGEGKRVAGLVFPKELSEALQSEDNGGREDITFAWRSLNLCALETLYTETLN